MTLSVNAEWLCQVFRSDKVNSLLIERIRTKLREKCEKNSVKERENGSRREREQD